MGRPAKDYNDGQTLSTVIASRSSAHPTLQRALREVDPQFFGPGLGQLRSPRLRRAQARARSGSRLPPLVEAALAAGSGWMRRSGTPSAPSAASATNVHD